MPMSLSLLLLMLAGGFAAAEVDTVLDVTPVWAGHRVGFCLLTHPPKQFAAFYDAERVLTVAERRLEKKAWAFTQLDEQVGWDSHNYITMAVDDAGHLHLAGNMHVHPLKYFRSAAPLDASTLERVPAMMGEKEGRVTYPKFFRGPQDRLIFTYRDGSSGSGKQIYNVYDPEAQVWSRLLDQPLTDGGGDMNAYIIGPAAGPDGYWHVCWVWRDTPDCATNHDVCYARSEDLVHWETSGGEAQDLPMTFTSAEVVDPVPPGGGVINGNTRIGFDLEDRVVLTYHKHDAQGNTQVYNARREAGGWKIHPVTDWDYRWEFAGRGSINFEIRVHAVSRRGDMLIQSYSHQKREGGTFRLDPETLRPIEKIPAASSPYPKEARAPEGDFPGLNVYWAGDDGHAAEPGVRYFLRWEALGVNRDRPREKPWPAPSMLRLYRLVAE